jgi:hypothetical protein
MTKRKHNEDSSTHPEFKIADKKHESSGTVLGTEQNRYSNLTFDSS